MADLSRFALSAMGTRFELLLEAGPEAASLADAVFEEIRDLESRLTLFRRDGLVARVNALAVGAALGLDDEFLELMEKSLELHAATGGLFDPLLGELMARHGFRGAFVEDAARGAAEDPAPPFEIQRPQGRIVRRRAGGAFDLGGLGKGFALDAARDVLVEEGIGRAFLHGGTSSVLALGAAGPGRPWRVAIPGEEGGGPVARLTGTTLAVSGPGGRRNARGEGHLVDPRRGRPVEGARLAAVVHPEGAVSDAWATAFAVDPDAARERFGAAVPEGAAHVVRADGSVLSCRGPSGSIAFEDASSAGK